MHGTLWMIEYGNAHVITMALDREQAKRNAYKWMGHQDEYGTFYGNPDAYICTPLTQPGDRIHLDITVSV